jgi:hypothetical protein
MRCGAMPARDASSAAQALFSLFAAFSTGGQFFPLVFTLL